MAKKSLGNVDEGQPVASPAESRPEMMKEIETLLGSIRDTAAPADPRFPRLTREQVMELTRLQFEARKMTLYLLAGLVGFFTFALCFLCWLSLHYNRPDLVPELLKVGAGLVGGFVGGYGVRSITPKRKP
jgi:hypothetical protein